MNIDKTYCINLERRPDRWQEAQEQFKKHNLAVERFPAVDGKDFKRPYSCDNANNGCTLSHYFIIERAKILGLDTVMIFEDDVELHENFQFDLSACFDYLPNDWDMLYFGGSHREEPVGLPFTGRLLKISKTLTTHGYIIRSTMFDAVINSFKNLDEPVDCLYVNLQKTFNCFVTNPPIAWQRGGFSDIVGREMYYPHIKSNVQ